VRSATARPDITKLVAIAKEANQTASQQTALADVKVNSQLNNPECRSTLTGALPRTWSSRFGYRQRRPPVDVRRGSDLDVQRGVGNSIRSLCACCRKQREDPAASSAVKRAIRKLGLIRLDSVAKLEHGLGPSRIDRLNRQFSVSLYATWRRPLLTKQPAQNKP